MTNFKVKEGESISLQNQSWTAIGFIRIGPELLVTIEEVEISLDVGKENIRDKENLSSPVDEVDGEEVVGIGASIVDP